MVLNLDNLKALVDGNIYPLIFIKFFISGLQWILCYVDPQMSNF